VACSKELNPLSGFCCYRYLRMNRKLIRYTVGGYWYLNVACSKELNPLSGFCFALFRLSMASASSAPMCLQKKPIIETGTRVPIMIFLKRNCYQKRDQFRVLFHIALTGILKIRDVFRIPDPDPTIFSSRIPKFYHPGSYMTSGM
jgi:hypothetical protein